MSDESSETCEHQDTWFDRVICPEPCGSMHDVCVDCGEIVGGCPLPAIYAKERANWESETREAVTRWLMNNTANRLHGQWVTYEAEEAAEELLALIGDQP